MKLPWSTHPYIRLARGFVYLVAIIDWYSRRVLGWRISNSMEAAFCVDCLEEALRHHGKPEIFNSDQGSQFTSDAFTGALKREGIQISMDGRGRAYDNIFVERLWRSVKHEDVYLKGYATVGELTVGLTEYFAFYNGERPHQSLGQKTPEVVYRTAAGGGAMILDKFGGAVEESPVPLRSTGVIWGTRFEKIPDNKTREGMRTLSGCVLWKPHFLEVNRKTFPTRPTSRMTPPGRRRLHIAIIIIGGLTV